MESIKTDIFFLHRRTNAIILEKFDIPLTDSQFYNLLKELKYLLLGNSELELLNFLSTYCGYARVLKLITFFFNLQYKRFYFPFWFVIRINCYNPSFKYKFLTKLYEIYLNCKLYF